MGLNQESGIRIGKGKPGPRNLITDVPGVRVGHVTLRDGKDINTGVTAILPHGGNLFRDKVMAASAVINGFGKTMGLVQVEELGTIETPIIMTNTLSIGTAATALIRYMLAQNPEIGLSTGTVSANATTGGSMISAACMCRRSIFFRRWKTLPKPLRRGPWAPGRGCAVWA